MSSVRHVLTVEVIKTLVTSLVVSHLWYCHLPGIVTSLVLSHVWYCHMPGIVTSLVVSHFWYCHMPGFVTFLVLSHLSYYNSQLSWIPQQLIDKFETVQKSAARLIFKT